MKNKKKIGIILGLALLSLPLLAAQVTRTTAALEVANAWTAIQNFTVGLSLNGGVTQTGIQGQSGVVQEAGTNSGSPGAILCNDSNTPANAGTSDCQIVVGGVTQSSIQGQSGKIQEAGTNSGTAGALLCNDSSSPPNASTSGCPIVYDTNGGRLTTGSCTTPASAFASCISTVSFFRTEPDTNYAISCTGSGITGWPYILGITGGKGTSSVSVEIGNGSAAAAVASSYSEIDCTITR